jgi:hypothetical protein
MKTDTRHRTTFGTRFRFLVRVLALFGVLAVAAGAVVALPSFPPTPELNAEYLQTAAEGEKGTYQQVATLLLAGGAVALALWLLVEVVSTLTLLTGRKTASGTNAAVQVALAAALLVVVNALSFQNYWRWDNTRDGEFTIAPELRAKLATLDPNTPTTIIALRVHKTASIAPDRSDNYDAAAERKVVEKVRDLTDVLREFGPKFDVHVLDTEDEDFAERLDALTQADDRKTLRTAIETAPENSIFFAANGKFRRMGFNEFLLYDKTASKAEGEDKSERNLVLIPQGKDKFIEKLLAVEARKPVVGVAVVHGALSTKSDSERISLAGMRVALERNGFEVQDIILKNWGRQLTPAARTFGEDDFAATEAKFNLYSLAVSQIETSLRRREKAVAEAKTEVTAMMAAVDKRDQSTAVKHLEVAVEILQEFYSRRIVSDAQARFVLSTVEESVPTLRQELVSYREKLDGVRPKYDELVKNDKLLESRRPGEVKARMTQFVDSCDVLIVPRLTVLNLSKGEAIQAWLHNWSDEQVAVLREFIAAGKPVLFALGPTSVDNQRAGRESPDRRLDALLGRFGITLGEQAIFTDAEGEAAAEADGDSFGKGVEPAAIRLDTPARAGKPANPLATAFESSGRLVDGKLPIRRSGFRPVYLSERARAESPFVGVLASTAADTWNESRPLPDAEENYYPRFTPTKLGDPEKGTRDEERRGPFDVGVAVEAPVPSDWLEPKLLAAETAAVVGGLASLGVGFPTGLPVAGLPTETFLPALPESDRPKPPTVRLVVLGHGGLFTGEKSMAPGEEALLLHALNWQLRRDDKLPQAVTAGQEWKYPRVKLDAVQKAAWTGGAVALLPLTCAVFGVIVLMIRRFR